MVEDIPALPTQPWARGSKSGLHHGPFVRKSPREGIWRRDVRRRRSKAGSNGRLALQA